MADEAYRAVFLRVHPTGKMVLSLTTESDGKEPQYAKLVAVGGVVAFREAMDLFAETAKPSDGQGVTLSFDSVLLHSLCRLLQAAVKKSDWDMELKLPGLEPAEANERPARTLN